MVNGQQIAVNGGAYCMRPLVAIIVAIVFTGCVSNVTPTPQPPELRIKNYTVHPTAVPELSSLCVVDDETLLGVSDQGGIYYINLNTWTTTPYAGNALVKGMDLEGCCIQGDYIYVVEERERRLYRLPRVGTPTLTSIVKITVAGATSPNKGLEGLDIYGDTVYMTNQTEPCWLIKYSLSTGAVSHIVLTGYINLSDIHYDTADHTLWIVDSWRKEVKHIDLNGRQIGRALNVDFISQAEGLVVDLTRMKMWLGDDTTGKIYEVNLITN